MNSSEYYRNCPSRDHPARRGRPDYRGKPGRKGLPAPEGNAARRGLQALWGNGARRVFPAPVEKEVPRVSRGPGENRGCREFREFPESVGLRENAGLPAGRILPMPSMESQPLLPAEAFFLCILYGAQEGLQAFPRMIPLRCSPDTFMPYPMFSWQRRSPEIIFRYFPL